MAILMLLCGVGLFVQLRWNHDRYSAVNPTAVWRNPPSWIRMMVRQTEGPIVGAAVVLQLWCLTLTVGALAILSGLVRDNIASAPLHGSSSWSLVWVRSSSS